MTAYQSAASRRLRPQGREVCSRIDCVPCTVFIPPVYMFCHLKSATAYSVRLPRQCVVWSSSLPSLPVAPQAARESFFASCSNEGRLKSRPPSLLFLKKKMMGIQIFMLVSQDIITVIINITNLSLCRSEENPVWLMTGS